jgi:signal transduction histidine kinase
MGGSIELKKNAENGALRRSELFNFIDKAENGTRLILSNLSRAADLINNFKQVAVDQAVDDHRKINLGEYLEEVLSSLRPKWKNTQVKVKFQPEDEVEIDTYPGAIAQIITNLITNSLKHGFEDPAKPGLIKIGFKETIQNIELSFSDNGKGMPREVIDKIFNPFFTTKRGNGGTGLGMHIVYNIVTQKLKGSVKCESEPNNGCRVVIQWPKKIV